MDVSIIIVNFNTANMVLDCVSSVKEYSHECSYEIIVVDNGSREDDKAQLRDNKFFRLIESKENLGFGRANNLGARYATGDYLFLLNPDTLLRNNAIGILYKYISQHTDCGICGGNLYHADGSPAHSYHVWYPSILSEMDFVLGQALRKIIYGKSVQFNFTDNPKSVAMITGADLMIRRDVWDKLKGFDPQFFMYCEDAELCYRTKQLGYRIISIHQAEIIHLEGQSFHETETHCRRIFDGRFLFFHKHHGMMYNVVADYLNLLTINTAICIYALFGKNQQKENLIIRRKVYSELMHRK